MISAQRITKSFGAFHALKDISFEINSGRITGIIGENGAGKTTILRILAGTIRQNSGRIIFENHEIDIDDRRVATTLLFGGSPGLYDELTAFDNIMYFARLRGLNKNEAVNRISELSKRFEMESFLNKKARELSTGMKQKVAIVRALIHNPSVIMLDEPETGLDFAASALLSNFLIESASCGKTVIISSHSAGVILDLCADVIVLKKGMVMSTCSLKKEMDGKTLEESFRFVRSLVIGK